MKADEGRLRMKADYGTEKTAEKQTSGNIVIAMPKSSK